MKKLKHDDKKSVISSEQFEGKDTKVYLCSWCSCTLSKLIDSSGQNPSLYCSRCQMSFDPEYDNLRKTSKLSVPDRNLEPAVATTPGINEDSVAIRHEVEIKGGLKALKDKGLKVTHYEEHIPK